MSLRAKHLVARLAQRRVIGHVQHSRVFRPWHPCTLWRQTIPEEKHISQTIFLNFPLDSGAADSTKIPRGVGRIISISYDETLLRTRQLVLEQGAYTVISALGLNDALARCSEPADLIVIGHSIPRDDKLDIIHRFRAANPRGLTVVLTRAGEERLKEVDTYLNPGD